MVTPISDTDAGLLAELRRRRLVAIVRGNDPDAVVRCVVALVEEGVRLVEVSLTGRGAVDALRTAVVEVGDAGRVGAGTVLSDDDARRALGAGACFAVTPGLGPGVEYCVRAGMPVLGGALTPTEIARAVDARVTAVKLFPASLGGVDYLKALRQPFPDVALVPVGGVDADAASAYLRAGAVAVGVGSPLVGDAADGGDIAELRTRAARFLAVAAEQTLATGAAQPPPRPGAPEPPPSADAGPVPR